MIGNDIIDLELARTESDIYRKGWLSKVFSDFEQRIIDDAEDVFESVWMMWSMKEAAYKVINRMTGQRGFFPDKLATKILKRGECTEGSVCWNGKTLLTRSHISSDSIHTIAASGEQLFPDILNLADSKAVVKCGNLPFAIINGATKLATKSHHGRFMKILYLDAELDSQSRLQL